MSSPPHRPKRSLGQHFLVDGNLQRKIVSAVDPSPEDEILEIGPGRGALTRHLVGRCRHLILVELDDQLASALREEYLDVKGVTVIHGDILRVPLTEITPDVQRLRVVGNIPYNITTPILFRLLDRPRPAQIVVMVQKEVGERILASPGGSEYGALTVGIQSVAEVQRLLKVPASAFRPRPEVDSVVLSIEPLRPEALSSREEETLRSLTRAAFQWRRKQMQTTLRSHPDLALSGDQLLALEAEAGYDLRRRPETFSPDEFIQLSRLLPRARR